MFRFLKIKLSPFIFLLFAFLLGCQSQNKIKVLKLAHEMDANHPVHISLLQMSKFLNDKSSGLMKLDIYPNGQLGAERELIELLQMGSIAMAKVSTGPMESFVPQMKIFSLPYVFRDRDHYYQTLDSAIGEKMLLAGEKYFLRGLCYFDAGSRSFYTKTVPIHSPTDLQGLKIRVQKSITSVEMMQALGGSPTPISWGELYTSLQQGIVDGAENNPPSFYLSKHYEVCKYYSLDEHTTIPDILLMSTVVWNELTPIQRKWLSEAVRETVIFQRKLWIDAELEAFTALEKFGVQIIRVDKKPFAIAVSKMLERYKGTTLYDLYQEIINVGVNQ